MNKKKIKAILEKNYYWFNEYKDNIDFGKHTPCGEEWKKQELEDLLKELKEV